MMRKLLFRAALLAVLGWVSGGVFAADPGLQEVYRTAESGQLKQAEAMMERVLRDHPDSGKAHFVAAEILAKEGQLQRARIELNRAEGLAPGLPFAMPTAVSSLRARVEMPVEVHTPPAVPATSFPWAWVLGGIGLMAAIVFFVRSRGRSTVVGGTYGPIGAAYGPGACPQPAGGSGALGPSGGLGSGILGGLATGAAVGAGMVAGEALMHRVFDGSRGSDTLPSPASVDYPVLSDAASQRYDMGGEDFGVADGGSWDDAGGGGDDWS